MVVKKLKTQEKIKMKITYYVNFEMDNNKDSARGGAGNWDMIEVDASIPEEDVANAISDEYGFLVYSLIKGSCQ
jgi:hypothetical protein